MWYSNSCKKFFPGIRVFGQEISTGEKGKSTFRYFQPGDHQLATLLSKNINLYEVIREDTPTFYYQDVEFVLDDETQAIKKRDALIEYTCLELQSYFDVKPKPIILDSSGMGTKGFYDGKYKRSFHVIYKNTLFQDAMQVRKFHFSITNKILINPQNEKQFQLAKLFLWDKDDSKVPIWDDLVYKKNQMMRLVNQSKLYESQRILKCSENPLKTLIQVYSTKHNQTRICNIYNPHKLKYQIQISGRPSNPDSVPNDLRSTIFLINGKVRQSKKIWLAMGTICYWLFEDKDEGLQCWCDWTFQQTKYDKNQQEKRDKMNEIFEQITHGKNYDKPEPTEEEIQEEIKKNKILLEEFIMRSGFLNDLSEMDWNHFSQKWREETSEWVPPLVEEIIKTINPIDMKKRFYHANVKIIQEEFVSSDLFIEKDFIIRSPPGSNKTGALKEYIQKQLARNPDLKIIILSCRRSYADKMAFELKHLYFQNYLLIKDQKISLRKYPQLIISLESLHKLDMELLSCSCIFILDEMAKVFDQLTSSTIKHHIETQDKFKNLMKNSQQVIGMDATMDVVDYNLFTTWRPARSLPLLYINTLVRKATSDIQALVIDDKMNFLYEIGQYIQKNKPFIVSVGFPVDAKRIEYMCKKIKPSLKIGVFIGTTEKNIKAELANVNEHFPKYDIVIHNGTIDRAISFDKPHFHRLFIICDSWFQPSDKYQAMRRARTLVENKWVICLPATNHAFSRVDRLQFETNISMRTTFDKQINGHRLTEFMGERIIQGNRIEYPFKDTIYNNYVECSLKRINSHVNFSKNLLQFLATDGIKIEYYQKKNPVESIKKLWTQSMKAIKKDLNNEMGESLAESVNLDLLKENEEIDTIQKRKAWLCKIYKIEINELNNIDAEKQVLMEKDVFKCRYRRYINLGKPQLNHEETERLLNLLTAESHMLYLHEKSWPAREIVLNHLLHTIGFIKGLLSTDKLNEIRPSLWMTNNIIGIERLFEKNHIDKNVSEWDELHFLKWINGKLNNFGLKLGWDSQTKKTKKEYMNKRSGFFIKPMNELFEEIKKISLDKF